ncbi:MAG TPA: type VI secretion system baseplate subunit TssE [Gemmatimonadales bacterium]|nr:type VI secretion system baseplate subunit TssE [Gemmatimonadales bacterium]
MAKGDFDVLVEGTLLDRLIDRDPDASGDRPISRPDSIREYKLGLQRDLEWLLNTRRVNDPDTGRLPELARSVYHYGLPDLTSLSRDSGDSLSKLVAYVEQALALFEPRLTNIKVSLAPQEDTPLSDVRLQVEAVLRLEPTPERITFDTVMHKANGDIEVPGIRDA